MRKKCLFCTCSIHSLLKNELFYKQFIMEIDSNKENVISKSSNKIFLKKMSKEFFQTQFYYFVYFFNSFI